MNEDLTKYKARLDELRDETKLLDAFKLYKGFLLFESFEKELERIENIEVRDEDVWVTSFPKSGTTWTQEMVWLLANNFDYNGAKVPMEKRYFLLEAVGLLRAFLNGTNVQLPIENPIISLQKTPGRRFVKTHLPWEFLPVQIRNGTRKPKIIHVVRNPKDVCVSYFHHTKIYPNLYHSLEDYFNKFISDKFMYSPYWDSVLSYWNKRDLSNVLIIKYEDMIKDLSSVIKAVADFLDTLVTDEQIEKLSKHLDFDQMKNNGAVNVELVTELLRQCGVLEERHCLMRKGKVGSYKEEFTEDMIALLNVWSKINTNGSGLKYDA